MNTSPHDAVIADLSITEAENNPTASNQTKIKSVKINWKKVNYEQYRHLTGIRLKALLIDITNMPPAVITERTNCILTECAIAAAPPPPKKKTRKYPWSVDIKPLAKNSVNLHRRLNELHPSDKNREKLLRQI